MAAGRNAAVSWWGCPVARPSGRIRRWHRRSICRATRGGGTSSRTSRISRNAEGVDVTFPDGKVHDVYEGRDGAPAPLSRFVMYCYVVPGTVRLLGGNRRSGRCTAYLICTWPRTTAPPWWATRGMVYGWAPVAAAARTWRRKLKRVRFAHRPRCVAVPEGRRSLPIRSAPGSAEEPLTKFSVCRAFIQKPEDPALPSPGHQEKTGAVDQRWRAARGQPDLRRGAGATSCPRANLPILSPSISGTGTCPRAARQTPRGRARRPSRRDRRGVNGAR